MADKKAIAVLADKSSFGLKDFSLTFYFDNKDHSAEGTIYKVGDGSEHFWSTLDTYFFDINPFLSEVEFDKSFKDYDGLKSTERWFYGCVVLKEIVGLENLKTDNVEDMSKMFLSCKNLEKINLFNFDTVKVKNMHAMFGWCEKLESVGLDNFKTDNVKDMSYMFYNCSNLKHIYGIENLSTSNVKYMNNMFCDCYKVDELDVSNFDTSKVEDMSGMFNCCKSLNNINISSWNTSKVMDMDFMFSGCENLKEICGLENLNTSKVEHMSCMFYKCKNLNDIDFSQWNFNNLKENISCFLKCGLSKKSVDTFFDKKNKSVCNDTKSTLEQSVENADRGSGRCAPAKEQER